MVIDYVCPQKKCFLYKKVGYMAKHCQLISINAVQSVTLSETTDVYCWQFGEKGHYKREFPHKPYQYPKTSKKNDQKLEKLIYSNHDETNGESKRINRSETNRDIFQIELACNLNSSLVKIHNRKY